RSSYIDWLNSQARKDLSIGVEQEDPTMGPIFESDLEPEALIDPQLRQAPELSIELRIGSSYSEPELGIELAIESSHSEPELGIELRRGTRARVPAQLRTELRLTPDPVIERAIVATQRARISMVRKYTKKHDIQHFECGTRARVPAQLRTELQLTPDPVIERAIVATQRARISMVRKYTKKHDIQHFDIGAIVSIKVPREDRTSTDNKRLFARILEEPYPYRYCILTPSGVIQRLIPTKSLRVVEQAL
ncbi:hypothetical protein V499_00147, partial [Pseudogymnoascus sp. VKM F-103]